MRRRRRRADANGESAAGSNCGSHEAASLHPACMEGNYESCQKWIQGELREVRVPAIEMVRSVEELFKKELEKYSAIFIGGGNTYKLLRDLKTSGCFGKIKAYIENDGIVFGGVPGRFFLDMILTVVQVWTKMRCSWIQKDLMY